MRRASRRNSKPIFGIEVEAAIEVVSNATPGFTPATRFFDRGPMNFSRDGSRLFVSCAPVEEIAALRTRRAGCGPCVR